uniref:acid phosphatase n=1 Tax=Sipha flava TaxID=143950 RepID=A0A2S2R7I7_9HEMI
MIFRHGDRAPLLEDKTYPNMSMNDFPEGIGQLTKIGKLHMYQKGKLFRRLYHGFISDLYRDREISIKTTNISRTFMSAQMVLTGMYESEYYHKQMDLESVWQPIPISIDSPDRTAICANKCPYYKEFIDKELYDPILKNINSENKNQMDELLSHLSKNYGQPIKVEQIFLLYDSFISKVSKGLQLPEWIKPNYYQVMESVYIQILRRIYGNKKLQKLISGPLLKEISLNMELRSNNSNYNTTRNMYLYAGHDMSLGTIMFFLGNNRIKLPEFGASIHFHLYQDKTMKYIIKVFYYHKWDDEKYEEMPIPICGNPCKLEDFIQLINENFSTEWEKECEKLEI